MKNMKIRTRLIVSYMIIIALLLIAGVTSVVMLNRVGERLQSFYDNQFQTVDNAWSARRSVISARANILRALLDTDVSQTQACIQDTKNDFQAIKNAITTIHTTFEGNVSLLSQTDTLMTQAEPYLNQICTLAQNNQNDEGYKLLLESYKPLMDQVRDLLTQVGTEADKNAAAKVQEGQRLSATADTLIITIIIISIVVSIGLGLLMAESIRKPVNEMMRVSADVAAGNLDTNITYRSGDELGQMADSMRQMTEGVRNILTDIEHLLDGMSKGNFDIQTKMESAYVGQYSRLLEAIRALNVAMSDTLAQIDVSADQVNSGGEQVSSGAQALAQGATEQASSVQELAATINQISNQLKITAEHAQTAKVENLHAHDEIQICNGHMNNLVSAMQVIDGKSKEISKVVKTIEDIAFQTNILALNAAVEAARAGSAGKGFAVVADEVRNLATKSQEAAKSTTVLIEETVKAVADGTRLSGETEQSLQQVVTDSEKVLEAVTLISAAAEEQSHAVAEVTTGIDQISSVVQTNSATAEQSAAASEELSGQANLLKEMVGRFTLRKDDHRGLSGGDSAAASNSSWSGSGSKSLPAFTGAGGNDKY